MIKYWAAQILFAFHVHLIQPSVVSRTGNYAAPVGSSIQMDCVPPNAMNRTQAIGRGSFVWTDEIGKEILNPRIDILAKGRLQIRRLHESDSGVYHCKFRPLSALSHDGGPSRIFVHKLIVYELPGHKFQTLVMFDVTQYSSESTITSLRNLMKDRICKASQLCSPGPVKTETCEMSDTDKQMCEISMSYENVMLSTSGKCDERCTRKTMVERLKQAQRLLETALETESQNEKSLLKPDIQSFDTKHVLTCRPGYHLVESNYEKCFPCLPGSFSEGEGLKCDLCHIGFFQEKFGSRKCEQCPDDKTTEAAGSKSRDECRPITDTGILKDIKQGIASLFKG